MILTIIAFVIAIKRFRILVHRSLGIRRSAQVSISRRFEYRAKMFLFFDVIFVVAMIEAILAFAVTYVGLLGPMGREVADACIKAPLLDLMLGIFSWIPWLIASLACGWRGLFGSFIGEVIALAIWIVGHEFLNREASMGPRIFKVLDRTVGRWRNHGALFVTVVALPGFLLVRMYQIGFYWMLVKLLNFPKYNQGDWVNISRQKFSGLIGYDLIWCLYCDWMTGVYSLGAEMLRNVESFWCPIRFYDGKKCDNCKLDFPDIAGGWVPADGTMAQVTHTLETMYTNTGERAWFGHPVRLTVKGK